MNLYEINESIEALLNEAFDFETGELLDTERLDQLSLLREEKILNIAKLIKNLSADQKAVAVEKDKFQQWEQSLKKRISSLKNYLVMNLKEGEKLKDNQIAVSFKKPVNKVNIIDIDQIPNEYKKTYVLADKASIKAMLNDGVLIAGASLELGQPSVLIK